MSAIDPIFRPRYLLSAACAASSTTGIPSARSGSRSAGCPARSTGRTAFVRSVTAAATSAGSMLRSSSSTSTNTGVAPVCTITFAVAGQVIGDVITSSPGPIPRATSARWSAAVPEARASTCSASRYSAMRRSSSAARGPVVSHPERSVSATAAISSSPIAGGWNPSIAGRRVVSDESFDISLESNHRFSLRGALEGFLPGVADRQNGACPVGSPSEGLETMAGAAVDPDAPNPVLGEGLFDAGPLTQLARRSDEKANAGTAGARPRREPRRRNLLPKRCGQGSAVQVDAERDAAELGVVTPAESRGELTHARAFGADQHLCVARALHDPDRRGRGRCRLDDRSDLRRLEPARPRMSQRHAESRQRRGQPVGHGEWVEMPSGREGVDRDLEAGHVLLDEQRRGPSGVEGDAHGLAGLVGGTHERQPALPLPVRCLDHAGKPDPLGSRSRLLGARADLELRLRNA